jgi:hypothetical protein
VRLNGFTRRRKGAKRRRKAQHPKILSPCGRGWREAPGEGFACRRLEASKGNFSGSISNHARSRLALYPSPFRRSRGSLPLPQACPERLPCRQSKGGEGVLGATASYYVPMPRMMSTSASMTESIPGFVAKKLRMAASCVISAVETAPTPATELPTIAPR